MKSLDLAPGPVMNGYAIRWSRHELLDPKRVRFWFPGCQPEHAAVGVDVVETRDIVRVRITTGRRPDSAYQPIIAKAFSLSVTVELSKALGDRLLVDDTGV